MTETERYARQTRNATVTIAVVLCAGLVLGFILAVIGFLGTLPTTSGISGGYDSTPAPTRELRLCDVNPTYAC